MLSLKDQAMWALGNIAGDCAELRDLVLNAGILPIMVSILKKNLMKLKLHILIMLIYKERKEQYFEFLDNISWTRNLSQQKLPNDQYKYEIIECLCHLMTN